MVADDTIRYPQTNGKRLRWARCGVSTSTTC